MELFLMGMIGVSAPPWGSPEGEPLPSPPRHYLLPVSASRSFLCSRQCSSSRICAAHFKAFTSSVQSWLELLEQAVHGLQSDQKTMDVPFAVSSLLGPPSSNRKVSCSADTTLLLPSTYVLEYGLTWRRLQRTHDRISDISTRQSPCSVHEAEASITNARSFGLENIRMPAIQRFRGDGLDMRRPVMSTQPPQNGAQNVIDLTEEPPSPVFAPQNNVHPLNRRTSPPPRARRGPRYEREIIDADASAVDLRESSPEVQFIRARPRSRSASGHSQRPTGNTTRVSAAFRSLPAAPPDQVHGRATALPSISRFMPDIGAIIAGRNHRPRDELVQIEDWQLSGFEAPDLNFGLQGFNLEQPSRPVDQQPRLPIYDAPPAPRAGFTRELKEDDVLVCANCDDELGVGDDDVKRQVWIIKACGHVSITVKSFSFHF